MSRGMSSHHIRAIAPAIFFCILNGKYDIVMLYGSHLFTYHLFDRVLHQIRKVF